MATLFAILSSASLIQSVRSLTNYPSPSVSNLEHLLVDSSGHNSAGFYRGVTPCGVYITTPENQLTGRDTAGQWMRVAFHDFTTADVQKGTGGLDASITMEFDREENHGNAFPDSFSYWAPYVNKYTSFSDMIALGTVAAMAACGGPKMVYSGGRIDAKTPGPFGVPEPITGIEETLKQMATAGLSKSESIALTFCGHSVGRVHHAGFPEVVGPEHVTPNNTQGGIDMDSSWNKYDNKIATEYLDGTTTNPLVNSYNESARSDLRMFLSDKNVTAKKLAASEDVFRKTCSDVTTKMINTVPKGVQLTQIVPMPVKPVGVAVAVSASGAITLSGQIRLLGTQYPKNAQRVVRVTLVGTDGKTYRNAVAANTSDALTGASVYLDGASTFYHKFSAPITASKGVSGFRVSVQERPGAAVTQLKDTYAIDDRVAVLPALSSATITGTQVSGTFAAAVKSSLSLASVTAVHARFTVPLPRADGTPNPNLVALELPLLPGKKLGSSGYTLYTAAGNWAGVVPPSVMNGTVEVVATLNGGKEARDEGWHVQDILA